MARNIDITTRLESVEAMAVKVAALADHGPIDIAQDDTCFVCARGSVKRRTVSPTEGPRIFAHRAHQAGPQASGFVSAPTTAPDAWREALSRAAGHAGRVCTHRTLSRVGSTRVHLERVENLRDFLARAVVLSADERREAGVEEAHHLMASLGIAAAQRIEEASVDLLAHQRAARTVSQTGRDTGVGRACTSHVTPTQRGVREHQAKGCPRRWPNKGVQATANSLRCAAVVHATSPS